MTGVRAEISIEDAAVRAAFAELQRVMVDTTPIMAAIGTGLVSSTHTRFERAQDPDGNAWAPLNAAYAATKRGPGILREAGMRGGLMGSVTHSAGRDRVEVGSNKVYAAIHQLGGTITPRSASHLVFEMGGGPVFARSVTIPARPFIGVSAEDEAMMLDVIEGTLGRAIDQSGASPSR